MPSAAPQKPAAPSRSFVRQSMMNPPSLLLCMSSSKFVHVLPRSSRFTRTIPMKYLHTMVRVADIEQSLRFYRDALGLRELSRRDYPQGRYTLVFLAAPGDDAGQGELTHNWDPEAYSG